MFVLEVWEATKYENFPFGFLLWKPKISLVDIANK